MQYWLMKSEPDAFSVDDLAERPKQTEPWDGVRNYQARNWLRNSMRAGDMAFFYHSSCAVPGIVGMMKVVTAGQVDPTAFDPTSPYYDADSDPQTPRWYSVDVKLLRKFKRVITLAELKKHPQLKNMLILQRGNRLSITPVSVREWQFILGLE